MNPQARYSVIRSLSSLVKIENVNSEKNGYSGNKISHQIKYYFRLYFAMTQIFKEIDQHGWHLSASGDNDKIQQVGLPNRF